MSFSVSTIEKQQAIILLWNAQMNTARVWRCLHWREKSTSGLMHLKIGEHQSLINMTVITVWTYLKRRWVTLILLFMKRCSLIYKFWPGNWLSVSDPHILLSWRFSSITGCVHGRSIGCWPMSTKTQISVAFMGMVFLKAKTFLYVWHNLGPSLKAQKQAAVFRIAAHFSRKKV